VHEARVASNSRRPKVITFRSARRPHKMILKLRTYCPTFLLDVTPGRVFLLVARANDSLFCFLLPSPSFSPSRKLEIFLAIYLGQFSPSLFLSLSLSVFLSHSLETSKFDRECLFKLLLIADDSASAALSPSASTPRTEISSFARALFFFQGPNK